MDGLVDGDRSAQVRERIRGRRHESLGADVVTEHQRRLLVGVMAGTEERAADHGEGVVNVRRDQPVEVLERRLVELRLPGHAEHRDVRPVDDRCHSGRFVRCTADHRHEVGVAGDHLVGCRHGVGRLTTSVELLALHVPATDAAVAVDRGGRGQARGVVGGAEAGVRASERRNHSDEKVARAEPAARRSAPAACSQNEDGADRRDEW